MIRLLDRFGRAYELVAVPGYPLIVSLNANCIPEDSVLSVQDDRVVDAQTFVYSANDDVLLLMVRAYHLPEILVASGSWAGKQLSVDPPAVPKLSDLQIEMPLVERSGTLLADGEFHVDRVEHRSPEEFTNAIEQRFADALAQLAIPAHEEILIAQSGGRDSLAMTYLLRAAADRGVGRRYRAATVELIALPADLPVAVSACGDLGIPHETVSESEVLRNFGIRDKGLEHVLELIRQRYGQASSIAACHIFMRASIEEHARKLGIRTLALGLHNEDLLATYVRSRTRGFPLDGKIEQRGWGEFQQIFPLVGITKKELTLYLRLKAPAASNQGAPSRFDRGNSSRDINYLVADSLQSLWPRMSSFIFEAHSALSRAGDDGSTSSPVKFAHCDNCRTPFIRAGHEEGWCYTCGQLESLGLLG